MKLCIEMASKHTDETLTGAKPDKSSALTTRNGLFRLA